MYGGNLGRPQGVDFLMEVLEANEWRENSYFVIVGSGTEYLRLKRCFLDHDFQNSKLLSALPKEQYDNLVRVCDVGLIFLDCRFTIRITLASVILFGKSDTGVVGYGSEYRYWDDGG